MADVPPTSINTRRVINQTVGLTVSHCILSRSSRCKKILCSKTYFNPVHMYRRDVQNDICKLYRQARRGA